MKYSVNRSDDYVTGWNDCYAAIEADRKRRGEPKFWYRPRTDGCYEGPIHNAQIDEVRKQSGGWVPLYEAPQPAEPSGASNLHKDSCGAQNENQAPQTAEPVPSGDIDIEDVRQYLDSWGCLAHPGVRALLDRYGNQPQEQP